MGLAKQTAIREQLMACYLLAHKELPDNFNDLVAATTKELDSIPMQDIAQAYQWARKKKAMPSATDVLRTYLDDVKPWLRASASNQQNASLLDSKWECTPAENIAYRAITMRILMAYGVYPSQNAKLELLQAVAKPPSPLEMQLWEAGKREGRYGPIIRQGQELPYPPPPLDFRTTDPADLVKSIPAKGPMAPAPTGQPEPEEIFF